MASLGLGAKGQRAARTGPKGRSAGARTMDSSVVSLQINTADIMAMNRIRMPVPV